MVVLRFGARLVFCLMTSRTVLAEDEVVKEEDRVVYQKKTVIDFSDVLISGELMKPDGAYVKNRKDTQFDTLIEMRSNFRPELMESASGL